MIRATDGLNWYPSPAKINLMLHITGRLPNGYHELQTLFQLLDYGDEISFEISNPGRIRLTSNLKGVAEQDNLIYKAAQLLKEKTRTPYGARISIRKKLPMGGGLGGGSSNAATTLVVLNRLWKTGLTTVELSELGQTLGADVPVFIQGHSAWGEGTGEILTAVELPSLWYLVIHPGIEISTSRIFNHEELTRNTPKTTIRTAQETGGKNDCEFLVCKLHPDVAKAIDWLSKWSPARLTGTGACVYAAFKHQEDAESVLEQLPAQWQGFVALAANQSELYRVLNNQL